MGVLTDWRFLGGEETRMPKKPEILVGRRLASLGSPVWTQEDVDRAWVAAEKVEILGPLAWLSRGVDPLHWLFRQNHWKADSGAK